MPCKAAIYSRDNGSLSLVVAVLGILVGDAKSHPSEGLLGLTDMIVAAIQYAKALGLKTIGLDISHSQLDIVKQLGADVVINTAEDPSYEAKVKEVTGGGCHAAAVFSASNIAYENAPKTLRCVCGRSRGKTPILRLRIQLR